MKRKLLHKLNNSYLPILKAYRAALSSTIFHDNASDDAYGPRGRKSLVYRRTSHCHRCFSKEIE